MTAKYKLGFSLLELLICLSIIVILTVIAVPTYRHYLQYSYRNAAKIALIRLSTDLASYEAKHGSLAQASLNTLGWQPEIAERHYALHLSVSAEFHYLAEATPLDSQRDDCCGVLSVNELGEKKADETDCW